MNINPFIYKKSSFFIDRSLYKPTFPSGVEEAKGHRRYKDWFFYVPTPALCAIVTS